MFSGSGPIAWRRRRSGSLARVRLTATVVTLAYLWLPYMVLPMFAGLERLPNSLLEAPATSAPGRP